MHYKADLLACEADHNKKSQNVLSSWPDTVLGHLHLVLSKLTALQECRLLADVRLKASCKVTPLLAAVLQCLSTCDDQAQLLASLSRSIH